MGKNLVIVESPAKAKTIEKFLGKDFEVKSSMGHIRDLSKKKLGIDVEKNYQPQYEVPSEKQKVVNELKKATSVSEIVWLASDEDREGEAIAWHLFETLNLKEEQTKRIVFHEITKEAIQHAIKNPRGINFDLVKAQQARRVLDRLVGFELSPLLWKKIKPSLSAGRVQSVAVKLIVERETEIKSFQTESYFRVVGVFILTDNKGKKNEFKAELNVRFKNPEQAREFLNKCIKAQYIVNEVIVKPTRKSPSPPFTTSTLQQEAGRKLGFSVSQTMNIAQKLYEDGKITYMRTDSVNLSDLAIATSKKLILSEFGEKYSKTRQYKTKSKGAQEAHEAIRPTYLENKIITGNANEKRLYELIWKRTIASQMADAELEKTTVNIGISTTNELFIATGEVIRFDGFLSVYLESNDDETKENEDITLPIMKSGDSLSSNLITAMQRFTQRPARYTEASLVKRMEELGIGRPSTYAPTISTIQVRDYVLKEDKPGIEREYQQLVLINGKIEESIKTEQTGQEKSKLFPTDIGIVVTEFLSAHFDDIMDFNFTADVEKEFDEIAQGNRTWNQMIDQFYKAFHAKIVATDTSVSQSTGKRYLGVDPLSGKPVSVRIGRYGPMVQIGEAEDGEKPRFAKLQKGQSIETITIEDVPDLFKLPRVIGELDGKNVNVGVGRFGPFIQYNNIFYSLKKTDDPMTVSMERAIEIMAEKAEAEKNKQIKIFPDNPDIKVLNGRFGPYISFDKQNFRLPREKDPAQISLEECLEIINKSDQKPKSKTSKSKKTNN
jgi:DNA topoisomerase-1